MAGLVIAAELAERRLVELRQDFAQLLGRGIAGGKTLAINLAQGADEGVAMLVVDVTVVVGVAIVETGLAHAALHVPADRLNYTVLRDGQLNWIAQGQPIDLDRSTVCCDWRGLTPMEQFLDEDDNRRGKQGDVHVVYAVGIARNVPRCRRQR